MQDNPKKKDLLQSNKEKEEERQRILTHLEAMERTEGWTIVKKWIADEHTFGFMRLKQEGKEKHNKNSGFLDGLTWALTKIETFKNKKQYAVESRKEN